MLIALDKPFFRASGWNDGMRLKERLELVMQSAGWDYGDLVRVSGQSKSVVSQWLGRGSKEIHTIGKMEAAERIEAATGFAALWIAKGIGPQKVAPLESDKLQEALHTLSYALASMPNDRRELVAMNLAQWARTGGDGSLYADMIAVALTKPPTVTVFEVKPPSKKSSA